jgi:hypothetical protein
VKVERDHRPVTGFYSKRCRHSSLVWNPRALPRNDAVYLRQGRTIEYDRTHQGPHGAAHPEEGYEERKIHSGDIIAEATSGNTGISFAATAIVDLSALDEVIAVSDGDAISMAQKLAAKLGLAVGISSGCNFLAAVNVQGQLGF